MIGRGDGKEEKYMKKKMEQKNERRIVGRTLTPGNDEGVVRRRGGCVGFGNGRGEVWRRGEGAAVTPLTHTLFVKRLQL